MAAGDEYLSVEGVKGAIGSGGIDVVNDKNYIWTMNTSTEARKLAPKIKCTFYQQTKGQIVEAANRWFDGGVQGNFVETAGVQSRRSALGKITSSLGEATDAALDSSTIQGDDKWYKNMYYAEPVGVMEFPFFSEEYADLQHQFENNVILSALGGAAAGKTGGNVLGAAFATAKMLTPGVKFEAAKAWGDTTITSTSFAFNLYNTVGSSEDTNKAIATHKGLVDLLIYLNSAQKFGPSLTIPPVICEYNIPGVKYSPVANMALNITSLGQSTYNRGGNIPDGYRIQITLNDMLMRARNFHTPSGPRTAVKVFADDAARQEAQEQVASIVEAAQSFFGGGTP